MAPTARWHVHEALRQHGDRTERQVALLPVHTTRDGHEERHHAIHHVVSAPPVLTSQTRL